MKKLFTLLIVFLLFGCEKKAIVTSFQANEFRDYFLDCKNEYMPSKGTVNVLIVPVYFKDQKKSDLTKYNLNELEKACFGESNETGWESISSYYEKSSYHQLHITGTITDWFQTDYSSTYYADKYDTFIDDNEPNPTDLIMKEFLTKSYNKFDFSKYDSDKDKTIDGIYLLYAQNAYNKDKPETRELFWAWASNYYETQMLDTYKVHQYVWASLELLHLDITKKHCEAINASTYIHETAHMMGVDDYYDHFPNEGTDYGVGLYELMYYNCGDHNPVTKAYLGWTNSKVISKGEETFTIGGFSTTGDSIIICPNWTDSQNIKQEYFIVDFFNQDNLNRNQQFLNEKCILNKSGIRIYHVNGEMESVREYDRNRGVFKYNNSNTEYGFVNLVNKKTVANGQEFVLMNEASTTDSFFYKGESFKPNRGFIEYQNKEILNFTIKVVSISQTEAKVKISIE